MRRPFIVDTYQKDILCLIDKYAENEKLLYHLVLPQFSWKTEFVLLAKEPGIDAKNQLAKYQKTVVLVQFN